MGAGSYFFWVFDIQKQSHPQATKSHTKDFVVLALEIPRTNDKKELAAEQMFAALHGILQSKAELKKEGKVQDHISFEIASTAQLIHFYVCGAKVPPAVC